MENEEFDLHEVTNNLLQGLDESIANYSQFINFMRSLVIGLVDRISLLESEMNDFCDRVEAGQIRSTRTYAKYCEILGRENKQEDNYDEL